MALEYLCYKREDFKKRKTDFYMGNLSAGIWPWNL